MSRGLFLTPSYVSLLILLCLLSLVLLLTASLALAQPTCMVAWDAPTTYADDQPLDVPIDFYRIYQYPQPGGFAASTNYVEVLGIQLTAVLPCPGWSYAVATALLCLDAATHMNCSESLPSNEIELKKVPGKPTNHRQQGD